MADPLIRFLTPRTVLISSAKGVGTGFFISHDHVLTCAHVVRNAVEENLPITLSFLFDEGKADLTVSNVPVTGKILISDKQEGQEYPDVALLKFEGVKAPGALLLPEVNEVIRYGNDIEYLAFGFQKQEPVSKRNVAQTVSLNYEGEEDAGHFRKIIFENGMIRPGMSGAPLVERHGARVTGLIHMTRDQNSNLGAFTIPIEEVWKAIRNLDADLYGQLNDKKFRRQIMREYRRDYPRYPLLQQYWKNFIALSIVLFFGCWWFFLHVGQIRKSSLMAALLVILPLSVKYLGDWLGKEVDDASTSFKQKFAGLIFNWRTIAVAGLVVSVLWIFISSVWIIGNPENNHVRLVLYDDERKSGRISQFDDQHQVHFLVPVKPFSENRIIKAEGREDVLIQIQSGQKKVLHYPYHFRPEPVIYLRFNQDLVQFAHFSDYVLKVASLNTDKDTISNGLDSVQALLIGNRKITIADSLLTQWRESMMGANDNLKTKSIQSWKKYQHATSFNLDGGDTIQITVAEPSGLLLYRKTITVNEDFTDLLVNPFDTL